MKILTLALCVVTVVVMLHDGSVSAQGFLCYNEESSTNVGPGGYLMPSTGDIRILVVYAKLPENTTPWPPAGYNNIVDNAKQQTYTERSMSHYFREMSGGSMTTGLNVIGDIYPNVVVAPLTTAEYLATGKSYSHVNEDVVKYLIDSTLNP